MAPPSTRRPGFSRRAQYGLFFGYILAVGGVLLAVMLLVVAIMDPRGFSALRGAALDVTSPFTSGGRGIVNFFTSGGATIDNYLRAASENAALKKELERTHQRVLEARALAYENRRLKNMLKLSDQLTDQVAIASIVGSTFDPNRRLATLAAGSTSGVKIGQPVRAPEGLIGRIVETGHFASRVLLITDGASNVPVQLVRDGTPAMATGRGDGTIDLKPLELGQNPFKRGDILMTSGTGGIYAPGIPVAMVVQVTRDETVARPLADPARIDYAIVQSIYQPAANQPLSAAAPPPAPPQPAEPAQ